MSKVPPRLVTGSGVWTKRNNLAGTASKGRFVQESALAVY